MGKEKEALWKFSWDFGFNSIEGLFIATRDEVKSVLGKHIDLSGSFGKNSEVKGILMAEDVQLLSDDPTMIETMKKLNCLIGYNPIQYLSSFDTKPNYATI